MDMRGLVSWGKMCAFLAGSERFCCGKSAICVEEIISPFGILIGIELYVFCGDGGGRCGEDACKG